jgi:FtsP/CotA-like multicopper oxidase with cupredoxin domain
VEQLSLAVAERVDALVEMNAPGVWVLGSTLKKSGRWGWALWWSTRARRARRCGKTRLLPSGTTRNLPAPGQPRPAPDDTFTLTFRDIGPKKGSNFDIWTINNKSWPDTDPLMVQAGKRYRLVLRNGSGDQHPIHLHRHTFEVVALATSR